MTDDFPELQDETLRRMSRADNYNAWLVQRGSRHLGRRVLDLGAGLGTFTDMLARDGREVVALEPDPAFQPRLHQRFDGRPGVTVLDVDASAIDLELVGEPFDSVVCFNVLEHIADDLDTLRRVRAVLRPGGALLLLVPAHPSLYGAVDRAVAHRRRYGKAPLRRALRDAGFTTEELRFVNPVGAAGWLVSSRILQREQIPAGPLAMFDRLVPLLRAVDRLPLPFGLSLWAVARPVPTATPPGE
jgi:SAM-dependent methyltransferase